ncbi:hypothetical protein ACFL2V_16090 [Pseudomonadota bacterium]
MIGYILGFIFFFFVSVELIGWFATPFGVVITLWVLFNKIPSKSQVFFLKLGFTWTFLAIVLDYVFIIMLLKPEDGYYKPDVYLYYALTLLLPLFVGWKNSSTKPKK